MNKEMKRLEVIDLLKKGVLFKLHPEDPRCRLEAHLPVQKVIRIGWRTISKTRKQKNSQSPHSISHQGCGQQNLAQSCPLHEWAHLAAQRVSLDHAKVSQRRPRTSILQNPESDNCSQRPQSRRGWKGPKSWNAGLQIKLSFSTLMRSCSVWSKISTNKTLGSCQETYKQSTFKFAFTKQKPDSVMIWAAATLNGKKSPIFQIPGSLKLISTFTSTFWRKQWRHGSSPSFWGWHLLHARLCSSSWSQAHSSLVQGQLPALLAKRVVASFLSRL